MNKPTQTQIVTSLVVLCCFVAGLFQSANLLPVANWGSDEAPNKTVSFSLAKGNLFAPAPYHENIVNGALRTPISFHKNQHKYFFRCDNLSVSVNGGCYTGYVAWLNHVSPRLSSYSIIYPFHYFL